MENKKDLIDIGIKIDIEKLISTRLIIQANSGGGKSYLIRKIAEEVESVKVQQIIIDREGEFVSLREKFPFALVAKDGGDLPLNIRYAEMLAHKILQTRMSVIIDLSEFNTHERVQFVKRFVNGLVDSPKSLWHPCVVIIDEAHDFAPEGEKSESTLAIINLCSKGRKRGFAPILATQRVSKLSKDASAECLNKLIGRTTQDIDRKRAGEELGFTNKQDIIGLRNLEPGEFYAFGPAISNDVVKFKTGKVKTTHAGAGKIITSNPPTPTAIRNIISTLQDIPAEAERELKTIDDHKKEITRLGTEIRVLKSAQGKAPAIDHTRLRSEIERLNGIVKEKDQQLRSMQNSMNKLISNITSHIKSKLNSILNFSDFIPEEKGIDRPKPEVKPNRITVSGPAYRSPVKMTGAINKDTFKVISDTDGAAAQIGGGTLRMLKAAVMYHPNSVSIERIAALAGMSHTSGTFGNYYRYLKKEGLIISDQRQITATEAGISICGDFDPLPTDPETIIEMWCDNVGADSGMAKMLKYLFSVHPDIISAQDLGEAVGMSSSSGTFGNYQRKLRKLGLIEMKNGNYKASDELFK